jgi:hypothetical protein
MSLRAVSFIAYMHPRKVKLINNLIKRKLGNNKVEDVFVGYAVRVSIKIDVNGFASAMLGCLRASNKLIESLGSVSTRDINWNSKFGPNRLKDMFTKCL